MTKVAFVGEAWGENEEKLHRPLVGASGIELLKMLDDAGFLRLDRTDHDLFKQFWFTRNPIYMAMAWDRHPEIFLTNVFNLRPARNEIETLFCPKAEDKSGLPPLRPGKYLRVEYKGELERLLGELQQVRPNLTVLLGNTPSWAVLRATGIGKIRGAVAYSNLIQGKCLPTYHPAAVLRDPSLRPVTVLDMAKASREKQFPEVRRPERTVYVEPTLEDMEWFYNEHLVGAKQITLDIETAGNQITCIGFSPGPSTALVVPFVDYRRVGGSYWPDAATESEAWYWVLRVLSLPLPKSGQNGIYDLNFLWKGYGAPTIDYAEDTMLLHHALQPESPKGLGYLGSVYTNEASWKLLRNRGAKHGTIKRDE